MYHVLASLLELHRSLSLVYTGRKALVWKLSIVLHLFVCQLRLVFLSSTKLIFWVTDKQSSNTEIENRTFFDVVACLIRTLIQMS